MLYAALQVCTQATPKLHVYATLQLQEHWLQNLTLPLVFLSYNFQEHLQLSTKEWCATQWQL